MRAIEVRSGAVTVSVDLVLAGGRSWRMRARVGGRQVGSNTPGAPLLLGGGGGTLSYAQPVGARPGLAVILLPGWWRRGGGGGGDAPAGVADPHCMPGRPASRSCQPPALPAALTQGWQRCW